MDKWRGARSEFCSLKQAIFEPVALNWVRRELVSPLSNYDGPPSVRKRLQIEMRFNLSAAKLIPT